MARDWVNEVREAMAVPKMPGVFVLGSFERRVTIYSQQVRALNLLEALFSLGYLGSGKRVAVIGGGVAGLTFAAAAAYRGVDVTVLERESRVLPLFQHAPNRWLHPRVYDWPALGWHHSRAGLPVLDWEAGEVAEVARQLEAGWRGCLEKAGSRLRSICSVQGVRLDPRAEDVWVTWNEKLDEQRSIPKGRAFSLAILAVGFGREEEDLPDYKGYWEPDDLDSYDWFAPGRDQPRTWMVSGCGDGALTDLLRLCIRGFRHGRMVAEFVADKRIGSIEERIREIEDDPRARDPKQPQFLHEAYQEIEAHFVIDILRKRLRDDTRVMLNSEEPFYFQRSSSALNRFLVAQLRHAGGFEFIPGKVTSTAIEGRKIRVGFADGISETVDRLVLRHGPKPAVQRHFPGVWDGCKALRDVWKQAPHLLDQTRERYWKTGVFGPEERLDGGQQFLGSANGGLPTVSSPLVVLGKKWKPFFAQALEPAQHFQGRQALVAELGAWLNEPASPVRAVALCAVGGTGKTAVVDHVLSEWLKASEGEEVLLPGGLFVWSFYENGRIEEFLAAACEYFLKGAGQANGRFERLIAELQRGDSHLLVLDGLEAVQAAGGLDRARGEIEDRRLKRLILLIASGHLGRARLLVTSRFPLCDLRDLPVPESYSEKWLDDLEKAAARGLLRAWKIEGTDEALDMLAERVGRHALSVRVLGAYLSRFERCESAAGLALDLGEALEEAREGDAKAAKLARLIAYYARAMRPEERDLMTLLSMFSRGVVVEFLVTLTEDGAQVAKSLKGYDAARLHRVLERLVEHGLAFGYRLSERQIYTAHPFLRDAFRALTGVSVEKVHEVIRRKLAPMLDAKPGQVRSWDSETLERYEDLIEHTRLAGWGGQAFRLYRENIGGYGTLGKRLGENERGARILAGFAQGGDPEHVSLELAWEERSLLVNDWGLYAGHLGDLPLAGRCLAIGVEIDRGSGEHGELSIALQNLADLEILRGRLQRAVAHANDAIEKARDVWSLAPTVSSHAYLAWACALLGKSNVALSIFETLHRVDLKAFGYFPGIWEVAFRRIRGDLVGARAQCLVNLKFCAASNLPGSVAKLQTLLGRLVLDDNPKEARNLLGFVRDWTRSSGEMEVTLHAHLLASELALSEGQFRNALQEAEAGRVQADACGFGLYSIDLRLAAARACLELGEPSEALRHAQGALERAMLPECGYAWGQADASHLVGMAMQVLGKREAARTQFLNAAELRERIGHPGAVKSRNEAEAA